MIKMRPALAISSAILALFVGWLIVSFLTYASRPETHPANTAPDETVQVAYVIDGDTIILPDGRRVRLLGMNAPELGEPLYTDARERLRTLAEGRAARLERDVTDTDHYGRLLRYVYVADQMTNETLVREGFARAYTIPPDTRHAEVIRSAERDARGAGVGIWSK